MNITIYGWSTRGAVGEQSTVASCTSHGAALRPGSVTMVKPTNRTVPGRPTVILAVIPPGATRPD
jgi:hypothetical protein